MSKSETIEYFDRIIADYKLNLQYEAEVYAMRQTEGAQGSRFRVESSKGTYEARVLAIGVGSFGHPNKPKEYRFPPALKERLLFDITSHSLTGAQSSNGSMSKTAQRSWEGKSAMKSRY